MWQNEGDPFSVYIFQILEFFMFVKREFSVQNKICPDICSMLLYSMPIRKHYLVKMLIKGILKDYVYSGFRFYCIFFFKGQYLKPKVVLNTLNNIDINKYQYWYPFCVYFRKIRHEKGR